MKNRLSQEVQSESESSSFELLRKRMQSVTSKEELQQQTAILIKSLSERYKPLRIYAEEGNPDILERLDFLLEESQGSVIDIGSYDGFFAQRLAEQGHTVRGVDMMKECIDYANEQKGKLPQLLDLEYVQAFAEDLPFESHSFDTALLTHTLEHVYNPAQALAEASRVVRPGGRIITIVPLDLGNDPTHLRVLKSEDLRTALSNYGKVSPQYTIGEGIGYICQTHI